MPPIGNTLTADQLNYLIWRYLQEQGQAKAAVNLQRDWRNGQDPENLPFAKSIKPLALVKLVHKGLLYYETEQAIQQKHHGTSAIPFFGYDQEPSVSTLNQNGSEDDAANELRISPRSRKHGRENAANGLGLDLPTSAPSAKRFRRSNGTDYATNGNGMAMAIDHDGDVKYGPPEHSEPISRSNSPAAEETGMEIDADGDAPAPDEAPARMTLTNGPSVGVQSDKVAEFGPETTLLPLPPGKHVTHTAWNPHDPSLLATAGDTLCRIWTIAKPTPSSTLADPASRPYVDMLDAFEGSLVSTIEWGPNGDMLALATRRGPSLCVGLVSLWTKHGKSIDELPATEDMVLTFRWNPSGRLLLGITNSGAGNSTLIVWHTQDLDFDFRADFKLDGIVRDAAWTSEFDFIVCGHNCVRDFQVDDSVIKPLRSRTEDELCHTWTHIRFDITTHIIAIAAEEEGIMAILNSSDNCHVTTAHDQPITALAFQPILNSSSYSTSSSRILATSSLDYSIKLWDAQRPFNLVRSLSIGPSSPPMAISFTADGYLMAAANSNRVVIWNPERGSLPVSSWKGESGLWQGLATTGMDQDSGIGEEEEMPLHLLSWDASGGKLAYGLKNQVAILNFRSSPLR